MRIWPPIIWPAMTIASLLILAGSVGGWRPGFLVPGIFLALTVCGLSVHFAIRASGPRRKTLFWATGGLTAFYLIAGAAGAMVGPEYAAAAVLAGVIPLSALCLMIAMLREQTDESEDDLRDRSATDGESAFPSIGMDDETPLGDTPEHSDAPYHASSRGAAGP